MHLVPNFINLKIVHFLGYLNINFRWIHIFELDIDQILINLKNGVFCRANYIHILIKWSKHWFDL